MRAPRRREHVFTTKNTKSTKNDESRVNVMNCATDIGSEIQSPLPSLVSLVSWW